MSRKEILDELKARLTAGEIVVRNALGDRILVGLDLATNEITETALKVMTRKCICCGAPWYEVDH